MGPAALELYAKSEPWLRSILAESQHWLIDQETMTPIVAMSNGMAGSFHTFQWSLPSRLNVVEYTDADVLFLVEEHPKTPNRILFYTLTKSGLSHLTTTVRGVDGIDVHRAAFRAGECTEKMIEDTIAYTIHLDLFFAVIAEPRLVKLSIPSRQVHRSTERQLGFTPAAWHSVSWTVGKPAIAKTGDGDEDHGMPLHVVRAHWRYYDRPTENSELRYGTKGRGWYVWVKHHFKGHPDFGIRLHHYQPKFGDETKLAMHAARKNATEAARQAILAGWAKADRQATKS